MKKILLLCLMIPVLGIGQSNVISSFRVFPKVDKLQEFEKALISHVQKFHTGDWKWNVWEVQSGPDYGGFMVTEGPLSWDQFDKRGTLGAEHTADWAKNVAPLTLDRTSSSYLEFNADLSSVAITDYADKILLNHIFAKPGEVNGVTSMIKRQKKVWVSGGESMAIYTAIGSGSPEMVIVNRLKSGLKELSVNFRKPFPERYDFAYGEGSWNHWLADFAKSVDHRWSEMLFKRADLSSK